MENRIFTENNTFYVSPTLKSDSEETSAWFYYSDPLKIYDSKNCAMRRGTHSEAKTDCFAIQLKSRSTLLWDGKEIERKCLIEKKDLLILCKAFWKIKLARMN